MFYIPPEAYLISWIILCRPSLQAFLLDYLLLWPGFGASQCGLAQSSSWGANPSHILCLWPFRRNSLDILKREFDFYIFLDPVACTLHPISSIFFHAIFKDTQRISTFLSHSLSGFLFPSLPHVWHAAINKMALSPAMWQPIQAHIWAFGSRLVIKSTVSPSRRVFLTSLLNVAQQLCCHIGKSLSPASCFWKLQKKKQPKKFILRGAAVPRVINHRTSANWTCRFCLFHISW